MHPEIKQGHKGNCPKCGMNLVLKNEQDVSQVDNKISKPSYTPLFVIILLIFVTSLVTSYTTGFLWSRFMSYFMIGYFLVFSGFKLMDLKGFASGYSTYDLLAQRFYRYGYIYPFIELFFGLSMILNLYPKAVLILEILIMGFSGIGVVIKLAKKEKFQCACLGTFLKVPLTKITLIEDFGMALMAIVMLIFK